MNTESHRLDCPVCSNPVLIEKEHVVICSHCDTKLELVRYNEKIVSLRRYIYPPDYYITNDLSQIIIDLVEKNLSPEKWGFSKNIRYPNESLKGTIIYDSEFCRIKFVLEASDYFPQHDMKVFYGRLHAPDTQYSMMWNDQSCRCWHQNILGLTLPFIEGISPQQLAKNLGEIWRPLVEKLNVDYPSADYVEYPLRLNSKIWSYYKEEFFSIFDLRNPELWDKYSQYSNEFNEAFNKGLNFARVIEPIC